jgi:hypothetical protein
MTVRDRLSLAFLRRVVATPGGRAHILRELADAEGNGENGFFEEILAKVDDPSLKQLIYKHQQDELRHERLFHERADAQGVPFEPVPEQVKYVERVFERTRFRDRPIETQEDVMAAYLMLQAVEERSVVQFALMEQAFREVDPTTADVIVEIRRDEERHIKYCHAIAKKYAPDEATRVRVLREMRELEAECFAENGRANLAYTYARDYFSGGRLVRWFFRALQDVNREQKPLTPFALAPAAAAVLLAVSLAATGCTRANAGGVVTLDEDVMVTAHGTKPRSELTMTREGKLDQPGPTTVMVNDAALTLHTLGGRAVIDELALVLDSVDLPPSRDLPHGLQLRDQRLTLDPHVPAQIVARAPDQLTLQLETPLVVHANLQLEDGTPYQLGNSLTEMGTLTVRVTLDGAHAVATIDAAPPSACWSVADLFTVTNCALFVESSANVGAN